MRGGFLPWLFLLLAATTTTTTTTAQIQCPVLRAGPPLNPTTPPVPFATDFTDKRQALAFLSENTGRVNTDKSLACRRNDHLLYNASLRGFGVDDEDLRGLRIKMDNVGGNVCDRNSQIATGHLLTRFYLEGGRMDLTARVGYGPTAPPAYHSADSFSCFGLYVHDTVSQFGYRNEISMCVSNADPQTVRMGVWNGSPSDRQEAKQAQVGKDLNLAFHTYSIEWGKRHVRFLLDEAVLWELKGLAFCAGQKAAEVDNKRSGVVRLPYEPMSVRIILRPRGTVYQRDTYMDVTQFAYTPGPVEEEVLVPEMFFTSGVASHGVGRSLRRLWAAVGAWVAAWVVFCM